MLRRFNSLIKGGSKAVVSEEEETREQVSLRAAHSVDSSLLAAGSPQLDLSPSALLARRAEDGQTSSLSVTVPHDQAREERGARPVAVAEDHPRPWKEGYEQANLDSPVTPQEQYEPGEKPSDHGSDATAAQQSGDAQFESPPVPQFELPHVSRTSSDAAAPVSDTIIDIRDHPQAGSGVDLQDLRTSVTTTGLARAISSWSTDSAAEQCRICQTHSEEPLIELGCLCRGEMAKSHKSCIETWFKNKGTNTCEVCQQVASNIPAPATSSMGLNTPRFWVWRLGGPQELASQAGPSRVGFQSGLAVTRPVLIMVIKKHPFIPVMWISLLAFMTYLFVDAINTSTIGYAAMPIGFLFGVMVVLALGVIVRLIMESCIERSVERSIRQMELLNVNPAPVQASAEESTAQNPPALPV